MTKADLSEEVAAATNLPRTQADALVAAVIATLTEALRADNRIEVRGFGSFGVRRRGSRTGRNPLTGVTVHVPAKRIPFFKPGKHLRDLLRDA